MVLFDATAAEQTSIWYGRERAAAAYGINDIGR